MAVIKLLASVFVKVESGRTLSECIGATFDRHSAFTQATARVPEPDFNSNFKYNFVSFIW